MPSAGDMPVICPSDRVALGRGAPGRGAPGRGVARLHPTRTSRTDEAAAAAALRRESNSSPARVPRAPSDATSSEQSGARLLGLASTGRRGAHTSARSRRGGLAGQRRGASQAVRARREPRKETSDASLDGVEGAGHTDADAAGTTAQLSAPAERPRQVKARQPRQAGNQHTPAQPSTQRPTPTIAGAGARAGAGDGAGAGAGAGPGPGTKVGLGVASVGTTAGAAGSKTGSSGAKEAVGAGAVWGRPQKAKPQPVDNPCCVVVGNLDDTVSSMSTVRP